MEMNRSIKKNAVAVMLFGVGGMIFSGVALASGTATPTTAQQVFTWSGMVPSAAVTSSQWELVDGDDMSRPLSSQNYLLLFERNSANGNMALSMNAKTFHIKAKTGNLKAGSSIKAKLNAEPLWSGPGANGVTTGREFNINLNGTKLTRTDSTIATVPSTGSNSNQQIVLTADGVMPLGTYREGKDVSISATIVFSAEV